MARCEIKLPEEFLLKVSRLNEKTDDIVPKVLEAGGEVVLAKVKSNLRSAIGRNTKYPSRSTGELERALGMSPVKRDRNENHNIKIGFAELRRDGESNAKLANILEFGKVGQPPRPFLKPARSASRNAAIKTMTVKLNEEIGKI